MGKLYKRNGTFYADYFDRSGQRCRVSTRTGDRPVALQRLRDLELATTDRATHSTETVAHALSYFVDVACAAKPSTTISSYRQKARHLARLTGDTLLDALDREGIERYIATRLAEQAHRHSVHKELVVLRGAIDSANARGRTTTTKNVVPRFSSGYTPRTAYLTPDQFALLVGHLVPPLRKNSNAHAVARHKARKTSRTFYCMLIALASPRRGELEALDWADVDRARGVIRVPKGKTKGRPIAIHPMLMPWLEALDQGSGPLVEPWANVCRDLPDACARAGVPRCTPNDLRRTFASWLVQGGVPLMIVSRLLGHSSTRMVDMVYGQLDEATLLAAIQRMPGTCDAGVSTAVPMRVTSGAGGTMASPPSIANSVEESVISQSFGVPKDRVELPTRGFSGLGSLAPKRLKTVTKLKNVK